MEDYTIRETKEQHKPENYVSTVHYRGYDVDVYDDDYGQQYYFILDGKEIGCGAYNFDYQGCIQYTIDYNSDHIEQIYNDKPYHPAAEICWRFNQETGERKKVIRYDGFVKELETQDGDYHQEAKSIMDEIDKEYELVHKGEKPRMFFADLMREYEEKNDSEK